MKVLCFLILILSTASARTLEQQKDLVERWRNRWQTLREAWANFKETCYGRCFNTEDFINVYWKMSLILQTLLTNYMSQVPWETIAPKISHENLADQCRILNETRVCINNCSNPESGDDQLHHAQSMSIIDLISRFCSRSIKENYECILSVWKTVSQRCNTRCHTYKQAAMEAVGRYRRIFERKYDKQENYDDLLRDTLSTVGNYTCRFLHCRHNCRKPDIVSQCGQAGYDTTKELLSLVGDILQKIRDDIPTVTPTGRRAVPPMPEECTADRLVEEDD